MREHNSNDAASDARYLMALGIAKTLSWQCQWKDGTKVGLGSLTYAPIEGTGQEAINHFLNHHNSPGEGNAVFRLQAQAHGYDLAVQCSWKSSGGRAVRFEVEPICQYEEWIASRRQAGGAKG